MQERFKYINHVARKQVTIYDIHDLENRNQRFFPHRREGKEKEKGIKYLETEKLLLLWQKKGKLCLFTLLFLFFFPLSTLKLKRSFQQFLAESSTASVQPAFEITDIFLRNYAEFESTLLLEQPSRSYFLRGPEWYLLWQQWSLMFQRQHMQPFISTLKISQYPEFQFLISSYMTFEFVPQCNGLRMKNSVLR